MFFVLLHSGKVLPSTYGVREPPWFCFMPSYWSKKTKEWDDSDEADMAAVGVDGKENAFEKVSNAGNPLVSIRSLRKTFGSGLNETVAVKRLSLDLYENQVFALLGHNGAGKTTTISMLNGFYTPTSGDASICGYSIRTEMETIREKYLGICPQHDALYDMLTVKEHLVLYGRIKGLSGEALDSEVVKMIKDVGLTEKVNAYSKTLSGGQKRKLSIALAIIGGPKVIVFFLHPHLHIQSQFDFR